MTTNPLLAAIDLPRATRVCAHARTISDAMTAALADQVNIDGRVSSRRLDEVQIEAYRYAVLRSELHAAEAGLVFAAEASRDLAAGALAAAAVGELAQSMRTEVGARPAAWGVDAALWAETLGSDETSALIAEATAPSRWVAIAKQLDAQGGVTSTLNEDGAMMRDAFRRFAVDKVVPVAEHIHREDGLIPSSIIDGLAEMGSFGLSIPEQYGGLQPDGSPDNIHMCIVTEELSRGSLGVAGSLITRPEILSKALLKGGTEEQKQRWLPALASGETLCAVAVTEPNFGSDVAGMSVTAKKVEGGWSIDGQKTWCTFAGYADLLMVLCRTNPDPAAKHRGLSILLAEKPRFEGHDFEVDQTEGGRMTAKAIDTLGYRGMHSFDVFFENWFVPDSHLIGGEAGLGRGFYYQMEGFAGGRLQTAARATGVMQAALDEAKTYAGERKVFGQTVGSFPLNAWKLARMEMFTHIARQFTYQVASLIDAGGGQVEASMVKLWASRVSEWVTREAMQIHGGMGYAEEYTVSRLFVDARVFSIFEGAEEVLALKVVARQLLQQWIADHAEAQS